MRPLRLRERIRSLNQRTRRYRILRDVLGALLFLGILLAIVSAATGGAWPPAVTVESGSMMHVDSESPYGRLGSLDVGDIALVHSLDDKTQVQLWVDGGPQHYGRSGDVILYAQNGNHFNTSILHRAITYVDVSDDGRGNYTYRMRWLDGEVKTFGNSGIYFPPLGFDEHWGFTPTNGYQPAYSGFITKGDNPGTNPAPDQVLGISAIVDPGWVDGTLHGELPWLGLGRLALQSGQTNPQVNGWERIGNAFAPLELWSCFFTVLALVVLIPFTLDTLRAWREHRRRVRDEQRALAEAEERRKERAEEDRQRLAREAAAKEAERAARAARGPVSFAVVERKRA